MNNEYEIIRCGYYAVIPATVRYDNRLKYPERLLYGEITALSNKQGYCFASNKYFSKIYDVSITTISRWISHLAELNYVKVEILRNDKNEITERRIYIFDNPYIQNNQYSSLQNCKDPIYTNDKDNNINNNIINKKTGAKILYAENVSLYKYEYEDLVAEIGKEKTDECIKQLSLYKKSTGKNYKDDMATIRLWVIDRVNKIFNKNIETTKKKSYLNYQSRSYDDNQFDGLYAN